MGIVSVSMNEIVVLKPITLEGDGWSKTLEQKRVSKLMQRVEKESQFSVRIALGEYFPGLQGLARSFQTAQATLACAHSDDSVLFYQDHLLPILLHGLKQDPWRYEQLTAPLLKLQQHDPRGPYSKPCRYFLHRIVTWLKPVRRSIFTVIPCVIALTVSSK
ncbi:sugar diacid utilization regulator SdaR [Photobacterium aphoticum]|uniref:Sugar diacid utilization regulator SdaR n=1 Tax=Photobacterium aphoticum TaxID=754436 RepID=A0A090QTP8_9GAMM|nr:sugar diacid utilization regulator SdaR [Photobacterium aphoticum]